MENRREKLTRIDQRIAKFNSLSSDPFYKKSFSRLNHDDFNFISKFLVQWGAVDENKFAYEVNRIGVGGFTECQSRNRDIIVELLACSKID